MFYNEAKAVVSAGRHLPSQFDWLVKEARSIVARNAMDLSALLRADLATMSPHAYEQVNLALAMRLAVACGCMPFGVPQAIKVVRTKPQAEAVAYLGVAA